MQKLTISEKPVAVSESKQNLSNKTELNLHENEPSGKSHFS